MGVQHPPKIVPPTAGDRAGSPIQHPLVDGRSPEVYFSGSAPVRGFEPSPPDPADTTRLVLETETAVTSNRGTSPVVSPQPHFHSPLRHVPPERVAGFPIEIPMANSNETFDLDKLKQLIELMEKHDLREVRLRRGDQQWLLRRGATELVPAVPMHPMPAYPSIPFPTAPQAAAAASPTPQSAAPAASAAAGTVSSGTAVKSPMVGSFYSAPQPGEPPFVKVGDKVKADSTVCLVEAMKFFNPIKADVAGTITQIMAKDGDAVEFGQTLFMVKPD